MVEAIKKTHPLIDRLYEYNDKPIELGREYYVAEWSWTPVHDGFTVRTEKIRFKDVRENDRRHEMNGLNIYLTGKNYRLYYAYQIHDSEKNAIEAMNFINSFGYDAPMLINSSISDEYRRSLIQPWIDKQGYYDWK